MRQLTPMLETSSLLERDISQVEVEMIQAIIRGYFECRSFFKTFVDYTDQDQLRKKKEFLSFLSDSFFNKFSDHSYIVKTEIAKEVLKKHFFVTIQFKDGAFAFPRSFVRYFDQLKDFNLRSIRPPDLSHLDSFMATFNPVLGLDRFFTEFFSSIRSIAIPLRPRELDVLRILSNMDFF